MKAIANRPVQNRIQFAVLLPTSAAAKEHSFRVYYHMKQWLGVELTTIERGWELTDSELQLCSLLTQPRRVDILPTAENPRTRKGRCNWKQNILVDIIYIMIIILMPPANSHNHILTVVFYVLASGEFLCLIFTLTSMDLSSTFLSSMMYHFSVILIKDIGTWLEST